AVKKILEGAASNRAKRGEGPVTVTAKVNAGDGTVKFQQPKKDDEYEAITSVLPALDFADSDVHVAIVEGDAFAPVYPSGTWLLLRKVLKPQSVPDGADVILEASRKKGVFHLRRIVKIVDGRGGRIDRIVGQPLAVGQKHLFFKPREVRLHYVVAGCLTVNETGK
ncbi:hypothetical protein HZA57_02940, partial [Candidatus Poribacteria bacterium]|nr:hypothetical protein [Candidatus Poribacteria bacterium]